MNFKSKQYYKKHELKKHYLNDWLSSIKPKYF